MRVRARERLCASVRATDFGLPTRILFRAFFFLYCEMCASDSDVAGRSL